MAELFGIQIKDMPQGWIALDAVILVKGLSESGQVRYLEMTTQTLNPVESLGMATTFADTCRTIIMRGMSGYTNP